MERASVSKVGSLGVNWQGPTFSIMAARIGVRFAKMSGCQLHCPMLLNDNHNEMRNLLRKLVQLTGAAALGASLLFAQFEPPHSTVPHQETQPDQDQTPTIKVDVNLVNILYSVKAKKGGALIPNLEQNDFSIFEDGKPQKIQRFTRENDLPITIGLLIDVSLSQENLVGIERQAASAFFDAVIRKKDEGFVIAFGKDVQLLQDMTGSSRQLSSSMNDLQPDPEPPRMGAHPGQHGAGAAERTAQRDAALRCGGACLKRKADRRGRTQGADPDYGRGTMRAATTQFAMPLKPHRKRIQSSSASTMWTAPFMRVRAWVSAAAVKANSRKCRKRRAARCSA